MTQPIEPNAATQTDADTPHKRKIPKYFWFLTPFLVFAFAFFGSYLLLALTNQEETATETPVVARAEKVAVTPKTIGNYTILCREVTYELCGHCLSEIITNNPAFVNKTYDNLLAEGWQVADVGANKVKISKFAIGLCPQDSNKRTIKSTEGGIAVYSGPKGKEDQLLMSLPLNIQSLPTEFAEQLQAGGVEFATEADLMETMENFDELIEEEALEEFFIE